MFKAATEQKPFLHLERRFFHSFLSYNSVQFRFPRCQSAAPLKRRQVALDAECLHAGGRGHV